MASIANTTANLYSYTTPVTNTSMLNDKRTAVTVATATVAETKFALEGTIVSLGNNKKEEALTYNALGLLGDAVQSTITQTPVLYIQSAITDTLDVLRANTNTTSDILTQLDIPGVTSNRI